MNAIYAILLSFILTTPLPIKAGNFVDDLREIKDHEAVKELRKELKRRRKSEKLRLERERNAPDLGTKVCAHCPVIEPLAGEVNKILGELAQQKQHENTTLLEEVGELEGMFYVTFYDYWTPGEKEYKTNCFRTELGDIFPERNDFHKDDAIEIFTESIDPKLIDSVIYRDDRKRVYFLRGKGADRDKVVKVTIQVGKPAEVTYYRLTNVEGTEYKLPDFSYTPSTSQKAEGQAQSVEILNFPKTSENPEEINPSKDALRENEWGVMYKSEAGDSADKISAQYGFAIETKDDLPRSLRILQVDSNYSFGEEVQLRSNLKIDDRDQSIGLKLVDEQNRSYVELEMDKDSDLTYRVPITLNVTDDLLSISGSISGELKRDRERHNLDLNFASDGRDYVRVSVSRSNGKTRYRLTHDQKLYNGAARLSIGLSSEEKDQDESKVWLSYKHAF